MQLEPFLYWCREREHLRERRAAGLPIAQWTSDPILAKYRFCNVRREDDTVTRWIRTNIREPYAEHSELWFLLCIARFVNWPPSLAELLAREVDWLPAGFDPFEFADVLRKRAERGYKVWTGAYLIKSELGLDKPAYVARTLNLAWRAATSVQKALHSNRLQLVWEALTALHGWGPFLAYQSVVDMRWCPSLLANAQDINTWAAAGPGTLRGLNRLHERQPGAPLTQRGALDELRYLHCLLVENGVKLDFSDVPNVCCEVDKYLRVKLGEGKPRALYHSQAGEY